ncbi:dual specificity protein phosphatase 19 [Microplitis demolitor]|uniref:dual specificity protein phosphatase 19 n=1 Tax=Microplitis demolitor TaxID=69319 RepID=UPI0006D508D8|nr:dual specificity protein phosphatase 19 [Microplitis demolitor]
MDFQSLIESRKKILKPTTTIVTNTSGEKYEISDGIVRNLGRKVPPFVIDNKPNLKIDLIIPGLFLSSQDPVYNLDILESHEIKNVLSLGINPEIKFLTIKYHYVDILDLPEFDLFKVLNECIKVIHENIKENILVHCNAGVSRSPTIVIGYLMACKEMSYTQAYDFVKNIRYIRPNDGFVNKLKSIKLEDLPQLN